MALEKEVKAQAVQEAPVEENVPFWKRKRFLAAVVAAVVAGYTVFAAQLGLPPIPDWVISALGAMGVTIVGYEVNKANASKE